MVSSMHSRASSNKRMSKKRISFVIPAYNAATYLSRCLHSIAPLLAQGHEAVVVNDGSTDDTQRISEQFAAEHAGVKIISQTNQGQSVARNVGIQQATGDYVWFLDSDDYLDEHLPDVLLDALNEGVYDVVVIGRTEEYGDVAAQVPALVNEEYATGIDYFKTSNQRACYRTQPWDKIVRRSLLSEHGISFEPGMMFEDMFYCLQVIVAARRTMQLAVFPYHYVLYNAGSLTRQVRPADGDALIAVEQATAFLQSQDCGLKSSDGAFQILVYTFLSSCLLKKYIPLSFQHAEAKDMVERTMWHPLMKGAVRYCAQHPSIGLQRWGMALCIWLFPRLSRYLISYILGRK